MTEDHTPPAAVHRCSLTCPQWISTTWHAPTVVDWVWVKQEGTTMLDETTDTPPAAVDAAEFDVVTDWEALGARRQHVPSGADCGFCAGEWPCVTLRALDQLEDARAENARLREVIAYAVMTMKGWQGYGQPSPINDLTNWLDAALAVPRAGESPAQEPPHG